MRVRPINPKVKASAGGGAGAVVLVWLLSQLGIDMPPEVAASVVLVVSSFAGWLKPA